MEHAPSAQLRVLQRSLLQSSLRKLQEAAATASAYAAVGLVLKNTTSYPVVSLPPEITSEIFRLCLPRPEAVTSTAQAPMVFLSTCRTWSSVAKTTPALWRRLHLNLDTLEIRELSAIVETWVRACPNHGLSLRLTGELDSHPHAHRILHALQQLAPKMSNLTLNLDVTPSTIALLQAHTLHLNQLEQLRLLVWYKTDPEAHLNDVFPHLPTLHNLSLCGLERSSIVVPWVQLTHFQCRFYPVEQVRAAVRDLPQLTFLDVELDADEIRDPEPSRTSHTQLLHLRVREPYGPNESGHLLDYFHFPQLQRLEADAIDESHLYAFIECSEPPLTMLAFTCTGLAARNSGTYSEVLQRLELLRVLSVRQPSWYMVDDFCQTLPTGTLSALQEINLRFGHGVAQLTQVLQDIPLAVLLRNRGENGSAIRSVQISIALEEHIVVQLPVKSRRYYSQLRESGVELRLISRSGSAETSLLSSNMY